MELVCESYDFSKIARNTCEEGDVTPPRGCHVAEQETNLHTNLDDIAYRESNIWYHQDIDSLPRHNTPYTTMRRAYRESLQIAHFSYPFSHHFLSNYFPHLKD